MAMRAVLPSLEKLGPAQLLEALRSNLSSLKLDGDEDQTKLYATLAFVLQSLPEESRSVLVPVAMHEGYVDADYLEVMAKPVDASCTRTRIDALTGPGFGGIVARYRTSNLRDAPLVDQLLALAPSQRRIGGNPRSVGEGVRARNGQTRASTDAPRIARKKGSIPCPRPEFSSCADGGGTARDDS